MAQLDGRHPRGIRQGPDFTMRLGMIGLGLCLVGSVTGGGCGVGTDPGLLTGADGAPPARLDAGAAEPDGAPPPPTSTPPIDQLTYEDTATATFALG